MSYRYSVSFHYFRWCLVVDGRSWSGGGGVSLVRARLDCEIVAIRIVVVAIIAIIAVSTTFTSHRRRRVDERANKHDLDIFALIDYIA